MVRILESSMERHLMTFRRDLTLDLFLRQGQIWSLTSTARIQWGIEPEARIPPAPNVLQIHLPSDLSRSQRPKWSKGAQDESMRWLVQLKQMHDILIPRRLRVHDVHFDSVHFWNGFLSACIMYDPPIDDLLGFADHPVTSYGAFRSSRDPEPGAVGDTLQMLAPPIQYIYQSHEHLAWERDRHDRLIDALHRRLEALGINLWEMVYHLEYVDSTMENGVKRVPHIKPVIQVNEFTTENDVRNAYKLLHSRRLNRPRAIKPKLDSLTSVQCAVLYYDLGWSQEQIAKRFGWSVQRPAGSKSKSETVRKHIAIGRTLISHRKTAA